MYRGCCWISANKYSCVHHMTWSPNKLWRSNSIFNPILHTVWLDNHALILKRNTEINYFVEKSRFLHTFLRFCCESRKIKPKFKNK